MQSVRAIDKAVESLALLGRDATSSRTQGLAGCHVRAYRSLWAIVSSRVVSLLLQAIKVGHSAVLEVGNPVRRNVLWARSSACLLWALAGGLRQGVYRCGGAQRLVWPWKVRAFV